MPATHLLNILQGTPGMVEQQFSQEYPMGLDLLEAVVDHFSMRRSSMPQPEKIQQLLTAGRAVAEGFLRDNGQVAPMVLAFSEDGMVLHSATSTTHPQVKDDFAGACRLLARANRSTAVVLILEAWARIAPPDGSIDTAIRPSTAPDRIEVVTMRPHVSQSPLRISTTRPQQVSSSQRSDSPEPIWIGSTQCLGIWQSVKSFLPMRHWQVPPGGHISSRPRTLGGILRFNLRTLPSAGTPTSR